MLLVIPLISGTVDAQYIEKMLEQTYKLPPNKKVDLNLKFAKTITVQNWSRDELGLKVFLQLSDPALEKVHRLSVEEQGDLLRVQTDYDLEAFKEKGEDQCWTCDEARNDDCICVSVRYEIHLPADAALSLETISGDIEIRGLQGSVKAKSISGFLDLGLPGDLASDLRFKSVTGEIYTDFDLKLDQGSSPYSKKMNTEINGGGDLISLETVSGNIYFRKL